MSTSAPTSVRQTKAPTVEPVAVQAYSKYVLVGSGTCRDKPAGANRVGPTAMVNARVKLTSDEASCANACDMFECEGYAYVFAGRFAGSCWIYGDKLRKACQNMSAGSWQPLSGRASQEGRLLIVDTHTARSHQQAGAQRCGACFAVRINPSLSKRCT